MNTNDLNTFYKHVHYNYTLDVDGFKIKKNIFNVLTDNYSSFIFNGLTKHVNIISQNEVVSVCAIHFLATDIVSSDISFSREFYTTKIDLLY